MRPLVVRLQVLSDMEMSWGVLITGSILVLTETQAQTLRSQHPGTFRVIQDEAGQMVNRLISTSTRMV